MLSIVNVKALCTTLTKKEQLDDRVAQALSQLGEDVVDDVVQLACRLAKHRGSRTLERGDIKFAFEKRFKLKIPIKISGMKDSGLPVLPQLPVSTHNYKAQLQLVRKEIERNAA